MGAAEGRVGDLDPTAAAGAQEGRVSLARQAMAAFHVSGVAGAEVGLVVWVAFLRLVPASPRRQAAIEGRVQKPHIGRVLHAYHVPAADELHVVEDQVVRGVRAAVNLYRD